MAVSGGLSPMIVVSSAAAGAAWACAMIARIWRRIRSCAEVEIYSEIYAPDSKRAAEVSLGAMMDGVVSNSWGNRALARLCFEVLISH